MISRVRRIGLPLGLLLVAGCLDFMAPQPGAEGPPRLFFLVHLHEGATRSTHVAGTFHYGADSAGVRPDVTREEIRVGDHLLPPLHRTERVLQYDGEWEGWAEAPADAGFPVEGVILTGRPGGPELRFPVALRDGPDSLSLAPGEDLLLPLRATPEPLPPELEVVRWNLQLHRLREDGSAGELSLNLLREGMPPERLTVPSEWHPDPEAPFRVQLILETRALREAGEAGYHMEGVLRVYLQWRVFRPEDA